MEVTEKLDGSQFAFGVVGGELSYRSKGRQIPLYGEEPTSLFYPAAKHVESLHEQGLIPEGVWFYGEAFKKPRHSTLRYDRVPRNHIALFGAYVLEHDAIGPAHWMHHAQLSTWSRVFKVEVVQRITQTNESRQDSLLASIRQCSGHA